jgi:hypothetical protein
MESEDVKRAGHKSNGKEGMDDNRRHHLVLRQERPMTGDGLRNHILFTAKGYACRGGRHPYRQRGGISLALR